jgi:hypothetical protein
MKEIAIKIETKIETKIRQDPMLNLDSKTTVLGLIPIMAPNQRVTNRQGQTHLNCQDLKITTETKHQGQTKPMVLGRMERRVTQGTLIKTADQTQIEIIITTIIPIEIQNHK